MLSVLSDRQLRKHTSLNKLMFTRKWYYNYQNYTFFNFSFGSTLGMQSLSSLKFWTVRIQKMVTVYQGKILVDKHLIKTTMKALEEIQQMLQWPEDFMIISAQVNSKIKFSRTEQGSRSDIVRFEQIMPLQFFRLFSLIWYLFPDVLFRIFMYFRG